MSKYITYCIYRIVCFPTAMIYIGQSCMKHKRQTAHFSTLKRGAHHNPKLQRSFDKYGIGSFFFEVIEDGIKEEDVDSREKYWINHYDSFRNGFNLTPGGRECISIHGKQFNWNGVMYLSISEAARANGIATFIMQYRANKGYSCDKDMPQTTVKKRCFWNSIEYVSINAAAKSNNIAPSEMKRYIRLGYRCDDDVRHNKRPVVWNGVQYSSATDAARANGVNPLAMARRTREGQFCDDDMGHEVACIWAGVEYDSVSAAAKANGINITTMHWRIKHGHKSDDSVQNLKKPIVWNGIRYSSISEAAKANGATRASMEKRIGKGYICDADMIRGPRLKLK